MGNKNRVQGLAFENAVKLQHQIYKNRDQALIWQSGTRARMVNGRWKAQPSRPDFEGVIGVDPLRGRMISFDTKSLLQGSKYHHKKAALHQTKMLWEIEKSGGIAFLLIEAIELDSICIILPKPSWARDTGFTVDLLSGEDGVRIENTNQMLPDYLAWIIDHAEAWTQFDRRRT